MLLVFHSTLDDFCIKIIVMFHLSLKIVVREESWENPSCKQQAYTTEEWS